MLAIGERNIKIYGTNPHTAMGNDKHVIWICGVGGGGGERVIAMVVDSEVLRDTEGSNSS
jgi:hypothetical protein